MCKVFLPILKEKPGIRKGKEYDDGASALFIKQEETLQPLGHFPVTPTTKEEGYQNLLTLLILSGVPKGI